MSSESLQILTEHERSLLEDVLEEQPYPCSVKELRRAMQRQGSSHPEYLFTRSLRELLSEGKASYKGGRWTHTSKGTSPPVQQPGHSPRQIQAPLLSEEGQNTIGCPRQVIENPTPPPTIERGNWSRFRRLLRYYIDCVRSEEGAEVLSYLSNIGKHFLLVGGVGKWYPGTGQKWSYIIPLGEHVEEFSRILRQGNDDIVVVLGYPIEVFRSSGDNSDAGALIRPVFHYPLDCKFTQGSINLSTADAQPEISLDWLKYAFRDHSEQRHFLSACGLLNQPRPEDEPAGFSAEDERPGVEELARALSGFMPKRIREALNPRAVNAHTLPAGFKPGIYNKSVIMLGSRSKYTQTLIRELKEIAGQSDDTLSRTSLKHLFKDKAEDEEDLAEAIEAHEGIVAEALPLNADQREAAGAILARKISVVTGPPGTGKSQVVAAAAINGRFNNQAMLFASRNHKAIDAVVERLQDEEGRPLIIRTNSKDDPNLKNTFQSAVGTLLAGNLDLDARQNYQNKLLRLQKLLGERGTLGTQANEIQSKRDELGRIEERTTWLEEKLPAGILSLIASKLGHVSQNRISRLLSFKEFLADLAPEAEEASGRIGLTEWWKLLLRWAGARSIFSIPSQQNLLPAFPPLSRRRLQKFNSSMLNDAIDFAVAQKAREPLEIDLKEMPDLAALVDSISELSGKIRTLCNELIPLDVGSKGGLSPDSGEREQLAALKVALLNQARGFPNERQREETERTLRMHIPLLLKHFPCWAVTNLSAGSRIPLAPGVFDLAVLDEASQCDIASAIPILFRSKRAAVVGDPNQLKHVSKLSVQRDSILRNKAGLTQLSDQRFSYRETSLYDVFSQTNAITAHTLCDTYRSCDDIASYSNHTFYSGVLRVATDHSGLEVPSGTKAGIHWTDVSALITSAGRSGCVCQEEIDAVYGLVKTMLLENNFQGSIGIVTPFRQQANRLQDRLFEGSIPVDRLKAAGVDVNTAHGFQGDERDVMVFSLCSGPDMPRGSAFFVRDSGNLFNVAVSRARAVLHIVGNRNWASTSGIRHVELLAQPPKPQRQYKSSSPWAPHDSPWEEKLSEKLKENGLDPVPQYPVSGRRLDLALVEPGRKLKIDIEVDGDRYHRNPDGSRKKDDIWRDILLQGIGWKVMRFWVYRLREDMDACVAEIERAWRKND